MNGARPLTSQSFQWILDTSKTVVFDGAAGKGAVGAAPLFTITGQVLIVTLVPFCIETLVGATATLALGVVGSTALFIAATPAPNIQVDLFWVDATPDAFGVAVPAILKDIVITASIIGTVAVVPVTDGTIRFDCFWLPLSSNGRVEAA